MTARPAGLPDGLGDQAERYLFSAVPSLGARERRALALAELAGAGRGAVAADVGVAGDELALALARARKALRRSSSGRPLAAGGRCERTERLLSDRLDGVLGELGAARLDAHLARCPRCREHAELLAAARTALREGFEASRRAEPQAIEAPEPPAGRLRPVPEPATLEAAGEPEVLEASAEPERLESPAEPELLEPPAEPELLEPPAEPELLEPPAARAPDPLPAAAADPEPEDRPEPDPEPHHSTARRAPDPAHPARPAGGPPDGPRGRSRRTRALITTLVSLAVVVAFFAALYGIGTALDNRPSHPHAPWSAPNAPNVTPEPLGPQ